LSGRRSVGPRGARGGGDGAPGALHVQRSPRARPVPLEPQDSVELPRGAVVHLRTPGGGGFGAP
jgi:N-methylhydantoinase B/oxoprolinase/acetone carboxylase alpha subunit